MTEITVPVEAGGRSALATSSGKSNGEQGSTMETSGPHLVLINGQSGDIYGDLASKPSHSGNLLSWLSDLV